MKIIHVVPGTGDAANGMARVARLLAAEQGGEVVDLGEATKAKIEAADEVWVHGMWLPKEWRVCCWALKAGKRLVRMTHGSLSPIYLERQGKWKKRLVGPIERRILKRCERIVATCEEEKAWIEAYLGKDYPEIEVTDLKRFFKIPERVDFPMKSGMQAIHVLYLGRKHPLKGIKYLEFAVSDLNWYCKEWVPGCNVDCVELRMVSEAKGEELERIWEWCDVLCLPTLSENFGLVVAEALERGKWVITTDGAPAWKDLGDGQGAYLVGYRDGSEDVRVKLLKDALKECVG